VGGFLYICIMAIVYQHIRKDTNQIFYIGIGKNKKRATDKTNRNYWWHNIVSKYGYTVEIIHDGLTEDVAKQYETYYIEKLGRKDLGLGELVNLTDGGEGRKNYIFTDNSRNAMSQIHTNISGRKIFIYEIYGNNVLFFNSKRVACKELMKMGLLTQRKTLTHNTFIHDGEYLISNVEITQDEKYEIVKQSQQVKLKVIQLDKEFNIVNEFESTRDAMNKFGTTVSAVLNPSKIHKSAYGYYWIYKYEFQNMNKNDLMNKFNKKMSNKDYSNNELQYIRENPDNLTMAEMCKKMNCSHGTIGNIRQRLGKYK
jgi:hypothetical protein